MTTKNKRPIISVILAAGKGTRMQTPERHKVCHTLQEKSVIRWAIETYERCGIATQIVVVGALAEQVMAAAAAENGSVFFAFQREQRGTGHATKEAARLLKQLNFEGDVLVVAGDKILDPSILEQLIQEFHQQEADLAFLTASIRDFPSAGRVVYRDAPSPLGIIEVFDIARVHLLNAMRQRCSEGAISAAEARALALHHFNREKKAALAIGPLWETIQKGFPLTPELLQQTYSETDFLIRFGDHEISAEDLANVTVANLSVYLFRAEKLYSALERLTVKNAQQEEYLTDCVSILAQDGCRLHTVSVDDPERVMAFNTIEELEQIRRVMDARRPRRREKGEWLRRPEEWLADLEKNRPVAARFFTSIYGSNAASWPQKRQYLIALLRRTLQRFGSSPVLIVRTPGRVNIMGRHIDHQGGYGNMIAIDREFYALVSPRTQDQLVYLENLESQEFTPQCFNLGELLPFERCENWLHYLERPQARKSLEKKRGDWSNYISAAIARMQFEFPERKFCGMNIVAGGTIPIAAGLSSSSAIVVAIAEAVAELNQLNLPATRLVELCGEAEWYVGTRGGAADHAAMKFSSRNRVVQVGFFPFRVTDRIDFPEDHVIAVCNSMYPAQKTLNARDQFNQRIACYEIGRDWLRSAHPQFRHLQYLRDFSPSHIGLDDAGVYDLLEALPAAVYREELVQRFGEKETSHYLRDHSTSSAPYPLRGVVLYGLSEIERARHCGELLKKGRIDEFGRWMNISHDGDRVVRFDAQGKEHPCLPAEAAIDLKQARQAVKSGQSRVRLIEQSGAYRCSIPPIDRMVDLALSVPGVKGAQLAGAGLGGCMMALVHQGSYERFVETLSRHYYEPRFLEPTIFLCSPICGSGLIAFNT
ncbi:NTP transferase domain-containing protein [candidate division KSB1 bacterium]|nr:NTP transferase domain-containing protein [candidate division KSB1 bacterium]